MSLMHISKQRFDFIRSLGFPLPVTISVAVGDPNGTTFHILDDEYAYCPTCAAPFDSIDANSPTELEVIKHAGERSVIALRDHRQQTIKFLHDAKK